MFGNALHATSKVAIIGARHCFTFCRADAPEWPKQEQT